ncbi:Uncharacterised protein [Salmonella enterica subsp. enterica serovar Bovismorbificans]|uniref:Uncharacterized protein n=1 Tax=Salmonella enterica subsp. enterica serovar Bovismorbificans TaxID=58097 RepID=A0A655DC70_SALET|nr:Uncharacterised protein [Salmonella enterica subsp. enterica serovar Bovismorbificans]
MPLITKRELSAISSYIAAIPEPGTTCVMIFITINLIQLLSSERKILHPGLKTFFNNTAYIRKGRHIRKIVFIATNVKLLTKTKYNIN